MTTAITRTRVLVLFGGRSSEHEISCATAAGVLSAIDRERFDVLPVGITRSGQWVLEEDRAEKFRLDPENMPQVQDNGTRVLLPNEIGSREVMMVRDGVLESLGDIDVVFPLLHGPFGEDGTVQGVLELADVPFVGSGVLAGAAGMDKHYTKLVLAAAGIRVAPGLTVHRREWDADASEVLARIENTCAYPVFVKPARAGSSVGVSKVKSADALPKAMGVAFAEDDHVLIETGISGRELEVAILESRPGERPRASVAGEIVMEHGEFYDFASKYLDASAAKLVCPAELTDAELTQMQELAIRAFEALGCSGLSRVDFFLDDEGFLVNEINTMPGFTPISMFPRCWNESGISYPELITELIDVALAHAAQRRG